MFCRHTIHGLSPALSALPVLRRSDPPPPACTVDRLFGWVNERHGTRFPRLADLAPGTSLPALWESAVTPQAPVPPELVHATVDAAWKDAATGFTLRLSVVVWQDAPR